MRAVDVGNFENAYDAASILDHDAPPPDLVRIAGEAQVIAASDLPRALASARRIAPAREADVTPLLREIRLEPPHWLPLLPIEVWDAISHLQWSWRMLRGATHEFITRADDAAEWLAHRAGDSSTVVAVTHGGFRRLIGNRLEARGWRAGPERRSYANWSVWSYSRDGG
jgi:broad specificity phosphatase PhoE